MRRRIVRKFARKWINELLKLAEEEVREHPERTRRYVELAKMASEKYLVRIPRSIKRRICKRCDMLLVPGVTCVVRVRDGVLEYVCKECGYKRRFPIAGHEHS